MVPLDTFQYFGRVITLPAVCAAISITVLLGLLVVTWAVALFGHDDKRTSRALKIFNELTRLFRWRRL